MITLNYLSNHEPIILKAIREIRSKKNGPGVHNIYDYIMNSAAPNIGKKCVQILIDNLIQKDEISNRKTPQDFSLFYISFNKKSISVINVDIPVNL